MKIGHEKIGTAVNSACPENILARHMRHECHRFVTPTRIIFHDGAQNVCLCLTTPQKMFCATVMNSPTKGNVSSVRSLSMRS